MAAALNIDHKNNHNAADDARTTAKVPTFLLRSAAASGMDRLHELDTRLGTKTGLRLETTPAAEPPRRRPTLPPEHAEAHLATELLNEPAPTTSAWLAVWPASVAFGCDGAAHRAELAAPTRPDRFPPGGPHRVWQANPGRAAPCRDGHPGCCTP